MLKKTLSLLLLLVMLLSNQLLVYASDGFNAVDDDNVQITTTPYEPNSNVLKGTIHFDATQFTPTELGILWGTSAESMITMGNDILSPGDVSPGYAEFYYTFAHPLANQFYFQAYAYVGKQLCLGEPQKFTSSNSTPLSPNAFDKVETIGNNVSAYYIGDKVGVLLSDGTIASLPIYDAVFECFCEHGKDIGDSMTIAAIKNNEWLTLSSKTGQLLESHWGHCLDGGMPTPPVLSQVTYVDTSTGLYGYKDSKNGNISIPAKYQQATNPIKWNGRMYAWVQENGIWEVLWFEEPVINESSTIVTASLFCERVIEATEVYNALYGTSLEPLLCTPEQTANNEIAVFFEIPTAPEYTCDGALSYDRGGYHIIDDSTLKIYDGEYEDGSFLDSPYFPYVYIVASCFADGSTTQERLQNVMREMDIANNYQNTQIRYDGYNQYFTGYPSYEGSVYRINYYYGELNIFEIDIIEQWNISKQTVCKRSENA